MGDVEQFQSMLDDYGVAKNTLAETAKYVLEQFPPTAVWIISGSSAMRDAWGAIDGIREEHIKDCVSELPNGNVLNSVSVALHRNAYAIIIDGTYPTDKGSLQAVEQAILTGTAMLFCSADSHD